ncbi:MAG: hypothetical protein ACO2PM_15040 [Pyrobaculum sp.]
MNSPIQFYARIGMAELLARVHHLGEVPHRQFFPVGRDMPKEPDRFLMWLEMEFCTMLLSGKVAMTMRDSYLSYRLGCALLKGRGAVVAVNAPLSADVDEAKKGVKILFARRSAAEEIQRLIDSAATEEDLCRIFREYVIYPVGKTGRLWTARCGVRPERRPRDMPKIIKMLAAAYPIFADAAEQPP